MRHTPPLHGEDSKYSTLKFQLTRWSRSHEVVDVALDFHRVLRLIFRSSVLVSSCKSFESFDVGNLFVLAPNVRSFLLRNGFVT